MMRVKSDELAVAAAQERTRVARERAMTEIVNELCPACGDATDYCRGHGEIGDPTGFAILQAHDNDDHSRCWQHSGECVGL